jgi:hypothetical protein
MGRESSGTTKTHATGFCALATFPRIRNEIQALEAKAKTRRFRKPIATQLFTYHVA